MNVKNRYFASLSVAPGDSLLPLNSLYHARILLHRLLVIAISSITVFSNNESYEAIPYWITLLEWVDDNFLKLQNDDD